MANMRSYKRKLARNKANTMADGGKNGKSVAIFRMIWDGQQEAAGKGTLAKKKAKAKKRQETQDKDIAQLLKAARENIEKKRK